MARILIADDNVQNAELLEAHLDGSGHEVRIVANGAETLTVAQTWHPDIILLDIMMPKISGFEVCRRLRADPQTRDIGILMITALDQTTDVETAVEAGTDDFLTKPINKTELLLRVNALLAARQAGEEPERTLTYLGTVQEGRLPSLRR
ncbi:MAG: response regulator [Gemmataceae bacterium]|nr:response regulator [Gemmataceae bacterium]MCS7270052.1 response regulator [Gemmataceae bacterium]MDW8244347.1 response regulator [Thermogemmata sp.]